MKITVLMSTYNGEKYLREQIDSVLGQKDIDLALLIRDDGSSDKTVEIIEGYEKKDNRISHYVGGNMGPGRSFFDLIKNAPESDYYAFCDQDDVWDCDKLASAIELLQSLNKAKPNLYYSNLRLVDGNLTFIRNAHEKPIDEGKKYSALARNVMTGCTAVFNKNTKDLLRDHIPNVNILHDGWLYLICKLFGNVVYDFIPHISYRQHGHNVVGMGKSNPFVSVIRKIKRILNPDQQPRLMRAKSLVDSFGDMLTGCNREKVEKMLYYKKSFRNKLNLLLDKDICEPTFSGNLRYRFLVLVGRI